MLSYDASTTADLEPVALVLSDVAKRADECGVEVMVVGATARDILISHVLGIPPRRATADVDVAISVASLAQFRRLTEPLPKARGTGHTFFVRGVEVDVVPFGDIEEEDRTIILPSHHRMDVLGFREAFASAVAVRLPFDVTIAVASLPAQSILKLLAWRDRRHSDRKDAIDLRSIVDAYDQGPYREQLYQESEHLLVKRGFDTALAGAERLGVHAGLLLDHADQNHVSRLITGEWYDLLTGDMGGGLVKYNGDLIAAYRDGFTSV